MFWSQDGGELIGFKERHGGLFKTRPPWKIIGSNLFALPKRKLFQRLTGRFCSLWWPQSARCSERCTLPRCWWSPIPSRCIWDLPEPERWREGEESKSTSLIQNWEEGRSSSTNPPIPQPIGPPTNQPAYLEDIIPRLNVCDINPLAIYVSIVSVVTAWTQTLKENKNMAWTFKWTI